MLLVTLLLIQTMLFCLLHFHLSGHLLKIFLTLQMLIILSTSSADRASSHDAPVVLDTTAVHEDVIFTGIGSGDHDPQEPDSQRDSDIHTGHTPQEPSIQSMKEDRVYTFHDEQIDHDDDTRNLSLTERELGFAIDYFFCCSIHDKSKDIILWLEHKNLQFKVLKQFFMSKFHKNLLIKVRKKTLTQLMFIYSFLH